MLVALSLEGGVAGCLGLEKKGSSPCMWVRQKRANEGSIQGVGAAVRRDTLQELPDSASEQKDTRSIGRRCSPQHGEESNPLSGRSNILEPCRRVEYIIKILGLQRCADTVVGNAMVRGVSGGEKKRVTTGEILVGSARVLLMDEISTGAIACVRSARHTLVPPSCWGPPSPGSHPGPPSPWPPS